MYRKCKEYPGCQYFTIDRIKRTCYLKGSKEKTRQATMNLISGSVK